MAEGYSAEAIMRMFRRLVNRFVPMTLLPERSNFEQQIRFAFEKSSGRTLERGFELCGMSEAKITPALDYIFDKYGARALNANDLDDAGRAISEAVSELIEYCVESVSGRQGS
jgi:hypothetical protein